jgi:allantoate deiminase
VTPTTLDRCDILSTFTETPGQLTRTFLSPPMRQAHQQIMEWMRAAGMTPRIDPIGNLIGHYPGITPDAPTLLIGSHLDTVPNAGKYDGILGVMLGLSVIEHLAGKRLPFAIEVIGFSEEEGVRFSTPYFGSRALAGTFDPRSLNLKDRHSIYFDQAMRDFGLDPSRINDAAYDRSKVIGYLEAHIEQGPVLEALNLPVGIVTAIAGQSKYVISFTGQSGHAGTVPMNRRRDALAAAAEFVMTVESIAKEKSALEETPSTLVATVGKLSVEPGATNVIPGRVTLTLDLRDADDSERRRAAETIFTTGRANSTKRGVALNIESESHQNAVPMAAPFREILKSQLHELAIRPISLPSGAGHDAAIIANLCPVAMLFLRNPGGISHRPEESVSAEDVAVAEKVMLGFVTALANQYDSPSAPK